MTTDFDLLLARIPAEPGNRALKFAIIDAAIHDPEPARQKLDIVMRAHPLLTMYGCRRQLPEAVGPGSWYAEEREELANAIVPFAAALAWVRSRRRRKFLDRHRDSFDFARVAEADLKGHISREQGGAIVAAALWYGHDWHPLAHETALLTVGARLKRPDDSRPARRLKPRYRACYAWMARAGLDWREVPRS